MLVVISPAKTLDFETPPSTSVATKPAMLSASRELVGVLNTYNSRKLQKLMGISEKLGDLNVERYQSWKTPFNKTNAKQAVLAFQGDVYVGLAADTFDEEDFEFAQARLRILSGLYGVLRPLDLIQPYRLEMGTSLKNSRGKDLYEFWGDTLTKALNKQLKSLKSETLINLASNEYFGAIEPTAIKANIITPVFKDFKNGEYKFMSFFGKKARGAMSAYIIKNKITDPSSLKTVSIDGYRFSKKESSEDRWVFLRKKAA